jgi:hypothetical protein
MEYEIETSNIVCINTYSNRQKKILFDKINCLSSTEHEEIYRIININSINTSKNKNGIFFNLSSVEDKVIQEIETFVDYCISNKEQLDEYDKRLNECKINNNYSQIVNMNINLENLNQNNSSDVVKDNWNKAKTCKSYTKFVYFTEKMLEEKEKMHNRKMNSKFTNAKKKFSKKIVNEKKIDFDQNDELTVDAYII